MSNDEKQISKMDYELARAQSPKVFRAKVTEQIKQQARAEVIDEIRKYLIQMQQEIFDRDKDDLVAFPDLYKLLDDLTKLSEGK